MKNSVVGLLILITILVLIPHSLSTANSTYDDEFSDTSLDPKWHWIREDPTHWSLDANPGYLRIVTGPTDIWQDNNSAPLLLQSLTTSTSNTLDISTHIIITPTLDFQQGGLVIYSDDDNFVRLTYAYIYGPTFEFANEDGGVFYKIQVPAPSDVNNFHLRIVKRDTNYYGFYSQNGVDWDYIGSHLNVQLSPTQIGLIAFNGEDNTTVEIPADFDYFHAEEGSLLGDPLRHLQWYLDKISAEPAWIFTEGSNNVVIAVIDTGVDYTHVELSGDKTDTQDDRDYVNDDSDARDDNGHGTHVAGIAAAITNNGQGIAGVCPQCLILPMKVLDQSGHGDFSDIANAIINATEQGTRVINMSLGGSECSTELANAVNYAYDRNVVLVAAAGNACPVKVALGLETFEVNYPARFERVISVAATDQNDLRANFSSYGTEIDLSAPGVGILSTYLNNSYRYLDGTSMASPMIAGAAGLILSDNPSLTAAQVQDILQRSVDDVGDLGWDQLTGWGRVNVLQAINTTPITVAPAPPAACPSTAAVTETNDLITLYTNLRDEVLLSSNVGINYTNLFYTYGSELARILITDSALRDRTAQFLQNASEEFGSLLPGSLENLTLSQGLYDEANSLVNDIAGAGSEDFRNTALQAWQNMDLHQYIGQDTKVIWQEMQYNKFYLPIIVR